MTSGKWSEVFELSEGGGPTAEARKEIRMSLRMGNCNPFLSVLAAGQRRPAIASSARKD
jgi:hypothetical protein